MIFRNWRVLGVKVIVRTTPSPQCLQPNLILLQVCAQEKLFPWKNNQNISLFKKRFFFSRIFFRRFSFDYSFAYFLSNILLRVFFRIFFCGFSIVYLARIFFGIFFRAWTFFRIIFTDFLSNLVMRDHIKNQLTVVLSDGTVTQGFIKSNESFNTFVFFF